MAKQPTMQSDKLAKPKPGPATQRFLDISEIRDDVVVMKDGTMRAVLMVASINFALKAEDEQQAIVQAYITFLNSLEYPIQIVIQSRKMNIDPYLDELGKQQKLTENELMRAQIAEYRNFIMELVALGEIMQKRFYLVVPYDPLRDKQKKFFSRLSEVLSPVLRVKLSEKDFQDRREQLMRRVAIILSMLNSMSVTGVLLDTQALIELYYSTYNPDLGETERLAELSKIQVEA